MNLRICKFVVKWLRTAFRCFTPMLIGCRSQDAQGRFDLSDLVETRLEKSADHPITAGIADFDVREELYYRLKFAKPAGSIEPIQFRRYP